MNKSDLVIGDKYNCKSQPERLIYTKREMMAMAAMQALLTNSSGGYSDYKYMAQDAVTAADALLAELERTK